MAKRKSDTAKYAVTKDGERFLIQKEEGRYYVCGVDGSRRFRKGNVSVEMEAEDKKDEQAEDAPKE